jgi:hypothetical protein
MPIYSPEEVFAIMGAKNVDWAAEAVLAAVTEYFEAYSPRQHLNHSKTTRANIISDRMRQLSRVAFTGVPGTTPLVAHGLYVVNFDDCLCLRFKKFDASLCSSGIPTQQSLRFLGQQEFEGIPARVQHLEIGYVLNDLETGIKMLRLAMPAKRRRNHWSVELRSTAPSEVIPDITDITPKEPADGQKTIFRPKFRIIRSDESDR